MSETSFAKSLLVSLDSKSIKYPANHAFDPKTFALRTPFALPKLPHPPHPQFPSTLPAPPAAPGSDRLPDGSGKGDTEGPEKGTGGQESLKSDGRPGNSSMQSSSPAQGLSGKAVLETDEFWTDLKGFLEQRVRDEGEARKLVEKWRKS